MGDGGAGGKKTHFFMQFFHGTTSPAPSAPLLWRGGEGHPATDIESVHVRELWWVLAGGFLTNRLKTFVKPGELKRYY